MTDQDFRTLIGALINDKPFSEKFHDPATRAAALSDLKTTPTAALLNALIETCIR